MTFAEYLKYVVMRKVRGGDNERIGQAYFNELSLVRPDLAEIVRGSELLDPYHRDEIIPAFLDYVCSQW